MKVLERIDSDRPPIVYGDGSQTYDFIYVEDVARANVCEARADATDRFYNVGRGVGTTVKELVTRILHARRSSLPIHYEPGAQTFVTHRIGSTDRPKRELAFEVAIDLDEGLQRLLTWLEQRRDGTA